MHQVPLQEERGHLVADLLLGVRRRRPGWSPASLRGSARVSSGGKDAIYASIEPKPALSLSIGCPLSDTASEEADGIRPPLRRHLCDDPGDPPSASLLRFGLLNLPDIFLADRVRQGVKRRGRAPAVPRAWRRTSAGTSTVRGAVSSSILATSTESPATTPAASRCAALKGSMNTSP